MLLCLNRLQPRPQSSQGRFFYFLALPPSWLCYWLSLEAYSIFNTRQVTRSWCNVDASTCYLNSAMQPKPTRQTKKVSNSCYNQHFQHSLPGCFWRRISWVAGYSAFYQTAERPDKVVMNVTNTLMSPFPFASGIFGKQSWRKDRRCFLLRVSRAAQCAVATNPDVSVSLSSPFVSPATVIIFFPPLAPSSLLLLLALVWSGAVSSQPVFARQPA